ncbi:hypothetical protein WJX77_004303 [Trebouxia sp. C0004]
MARLSLISACKAACLVRQPVSQHAGAALIGLRQLCNRAADLSDGNKTIQATAPAVKIIPQQTSAQLLRHQAATISAVEPVQRSMPKWPDTQQHGQDEAHLKQLKRTGYYVKDQTLLLMHHSRGPNFDEALRQFYARTLAMCARPESCVNHIHLNAILGGLAKAWAAAEVRRAIQNHQQAVDDLHRFTAKILMLLQPVCKALSVREASSLLSSLSKLSIDPGLMVAGTVDAVAQQLMANMHLANGQDLADVVAAYSMLQLTTCCEDLMQAVSRQLAVADLSRVGSLRVAKLSYSLATIPTAAPSIKALDALCERFDVLLRSQELAELPSAQSIAITMWALSKLKYAPSDELAASMVGRVVALCHIPKQQPVPQDISNVLLACAELSLPVKQSDIDILLCLLLGRQQHHVAEQHYTNTAWSLAVLGCLHSQLLDTLIDQLSVPSPRQAKISTPSPLKEVGLGQLYQALDWLQPPSSPSAHQHEPWSSLQGKLHKLGPRPAPTKRYLCGNGKLCAALKQLQLPFRSIVSIQSYLADAVVTSPGNKAQPIILTLSNPDYITNIPGRLTGRAVFRTHLLAKQGRLVDVPHDMANEAITCCSCWHAMEPG